MDIFRAVKALDLPFGHYVVFGSGPLAAHGIRPTNDVDLFVTTTLYDKLKADGWDEKELDTPAVGLSTCPTGYTTLTTPGSTGPTTPRRKP